MRLLLYQSLFLALAAWDWLAANLLFLLFHWPRAPFTGSVTVPTTSVNPPPRTLFMPPWPSFWSLLSSDEPGPLYTQCDTQCGIGASSLAEPSIIECQFLNWIILEEKMHHTASRERCYSWQNAAQNNCRKSGRAHSKSERLFMICLWLETYQLTLM